MKLVDGGYTNLHFTLSSNILEPPTLSKRTAQLAEGEPEVDGE